MARQTRRFVCQACGASFTQWSGRCEGCGSWNTIIEEAIEAAAPRGLGSRRGRPISFAGLQGVSEAARRRPTGIAEFDRVCGGGIVPGSGILVGGDPGIGKSTLLLQVSAAMARDAPCVYISGEEAVDQVRIRAERLNLGPASVQLAAATAVRDIVSNLDRADGLGLLVIDSIQTMFVDTLESAPGTVAQVRASAQALIGLAKRRGFTVVLVGHVTKEGLIAGPKVLEHMVDTVLYFEGDTGHQFRMLRAVKNRFGPTDEIGVFEMTDAGLKEVANPSALFLSDQRDDVTGASVFAGIEGSRPLLVEIQSLIAPSALPSPRRAVVGWDAGRLAMVLAVLEARCGLSLSGAEVYLNVAGGLRIGEPAADLAVAAALVSAARGVPVPPKTVVFGEIGLSGDTRAVSRTDARLKEASKLGFTRAIAPAPSPPPAESRKRGRTGSTMELVEIAHVRDLVGLFGAERRAGERGFGQSGHRARKAASHG